MRKKKSQLSRKEIDWSKALKKARDKENSQDALRVVELIRQLHYIVIIKHGK